LKDNPALTAALKAAGEVMPVFVLDPALLASPYSGAKRVAFLFAGLRALDQQLRQAGSRLVVRRGKPVEEMQRLVLETGAEAIFAEEDFSPYARQRDERVGETLWLRLEGSPAVHSPRSVLKPDGTPYTVFAPYCKAWKKQPLPELLGEPAFIPSNTLVESLPIPEEPTLPEGVPFTARAAEAQDRLDNFMAGEDRPIYKYGEGRNQPGENLTSGLSPYLRFGMLSARKAAAAAYRALKEAPDSAAEKSAETWLNELIWRDFYMQILFHFPSVRRESFKKQFLNIQWANNLEEFSDWQAGQTGVPVVDAGMRQLLTTGWMHNRARMITASFLTKDMLIDWRWGEAWFMQHLIDGDPAANNGGWQWTAGTGTDAAPYFRIFNPVKQGMKFDPQGQYIKRWVPELANLPEAYIHQPWTMPRSLQSTYGCVIGQDYPSPLIDHAWARRRAMQAYRQGKNGD
jgi:deoxyribodipyrimidine photo-lyase